jgi:hypothetical protein
VHLQADRSTAWHELRYDRRDMIGPGAEGSQTRSRGLRLGAVALVLASLHACTTDMIIGTVADDDAATPSVGGSRPSAGGGRPIGEGGGGTGGEGGIAPACGTTWETPEPVVPPLDIILVVDNSGSMHEEIAAIEQNLNVNFAQVLFASQIDYQIVVVSNHGAGAFEICITTPLSNVTGCTFEPGDVAGRFHHYDVDVQSRDSLCRLLGTFRGDIPDQWGKHPEGWSKWLRGAAEKAFVAFTDDRVSCTVGGKQLNDQDDTHVSPQLSAAAAAATAFDHALSAADVSQFGSVADRRYRFYSVIGVMEKAAPNQDDAYAPWEPIVAAKCPSAMNVGPGYQWLSRGTDAGRYSICAPQSYDALFQELAADIIADATLPCEVKITSSDADPSTLLIEYAPGDGSEPVIWPQVVDAEACSGDAFYLEGDVVRLCPEACAQFESDLDATFEVTCAPPP